MRAARATVLAALALLAVVGQAAGAAGPAAATVVAADLPPATVDADEIRHEADDILAQDEYADLQPGLLDRIADWIDDRLAELSGAGSGLFAWLFLVGAVVALVFFATRFGRTVQSDRALGVEVQGVHQKTPAEWRAEAEALEADGAWKAALRCRYRALVGDLVAEGVLVDVAGRTTGEFRQEVAERAPDRVTDFNAATELFELAWYADRPTGPEENQRFVEHALRAAGARSRR